MAIAEHFFRVVGADFANPGHSEEHMRARRDAPTQPPEFRDRIGHVLEDLFVDHECGGAAPLREQVQTALQAALVERNAGALAPICEVLAAEVDSQNLMATLLEPCQRAPGATPDLEYHPAGLEGDSRGTQPSSDHRALRPLEVEER